MCDIKGEGGEALYAKYKRGSPEGRRYHTQGRAGSWLRTSWVFFPVLMNCIMDYTSFSPQVPLNYSPTSCIYRHLFLLLLLMMLTLFQILCWCVSICEAVYIPSSTCVSTYTQLVLRQIVMKAWPCTPCGIFCWCYLTKTAVPFQLPHAPVLQCDFHGSPMFSTGAGALL